MSTGLMIPPPSERRVFGISELRKLAQAGASVYSPKGRSFARPKAAAYVLNMSATMVDAAIQSGLYAYTPKRPRTPSHSERRLMEDLEVAVESLRRISNGSPFATDKIGSVRDAAEEAERTLRILGRWHRHQSPHVLKFPSGGGK